MELIYRFKVGSPLWMNREKLQNAVDSLTIELAEVVEVTSVTKEQKTHNVYTYECHINARDIDITNVRIIQIKDKHHAVYAGI